MSGKQVQVGVRGAGPVGGLWRHVKTGGLYHVVGAATTEEDGERLVIYRGQNGQVWARPFLKFLDGRFVPEDEAAACMYRVHDYDVVYAVLTAQPEGASDS